MPTIVTKEVQKQINGENGNVVQAHFYFIVNETTTKEQLESVDNWEFIYYNYRLPRCSNKKRKNFPPGSPRSFAQPPTVEPPPHPRGNGTTPPGCPRNIMTPPPRRHDELVSDIGGWWGTTEAKNLFAPTFPVGGTDIIVSLWIDLLDSVLTSKKCRKNS